MKKDRKELDALIAKASDAKRIKEDPYWAEMVKRLKDRVNGEMILLSSTATEKFKDLAQFREFLAVIEAEIASDIRQGKIAQEQLDETNGAKKRKGKVR
jgi:transcriptional antiterminator